MRRVQVVEDDGFQRDQIRVGGLIDDLGNAGDHVGRTEAGLYQAAAIAVSNTASGFSYAWIAGGSGLEARIIGEVMNAAAGMKRERASSLVKAILAAAGEKAKETSGLREFDEVYDLETVQPKPEYRAAAMRVKERLAAMGLPLE